MTLPPPAGPVGHHIGAGQGVALAVVGDAFAAAEGLVVEAVGHFLLAWGYGFELGAGRYVG